MQNQAEHRIVFSYILQGTLRDTIKVELTVPYMRENKLLKATTPALCSTISGGTRLSKYKPRITSKTPLIKKYFMLTKRWVIEFNSENQYCEQAKAVCEQPDYKGFSIVAFASMTTAQK